MPQAKIGRCLFLASAIALNGMLPHGPKLRLESVSFPAAVRG